MVVGGVGGSGRSVAGRSFAGEECRAGGVSRGRSVAWEECRGGGASNRSTIHQMMHVHYK